MPGLRQACRTVSQPFEAKLPYLQISCTYSANSTAELAGVLGDEPQIGKEGSGWGQTRVIDILQSKVSRHLTGTCSCETLAPQPAADLSYLSNPDCLSLQHGDQGNWLWCSKDDFVLDAIKKVSGRSKKQRTPTPQRLEALNVLPLAADDQSKRWFPAGIRCFEVGFE